MFNYLKGGTAIWVRNLLKNQTNLRFAGYIDIY